MGGGAVLLASRGSSGPVFGTLAGWRGDAALGGLSLSFTLYVLVVGVDQIVGGCCYLIFNLF